MSYSFVSSVDGGVRIAFLVQPRASRLRFGPVHGERLKISIHSPPVDGAANDAVVALVAKTLGVAKRDVSIAAGQTSRRKSVQVLGVSESDVIKAIE